MRILSFNEEVTFPISYLNGKFIKELSPEAKKVGIVALAVLVTMMAYGIYRLICFKGRRVGQASTDKHDKDSKGGEVKVTIKNSKEGEVGRELRKDWKLEGAAKKFEEILKHNPKDMFSTIQYAKTLKALKKGDEALKQITKVVEHCKIEKDSHPKNSQALREYANALYLKEFYFEVHKKDNFKKLEHILSCLEKAIEINPRDILALRLQLKCLLIESIFEVIKKNYPPHSNLNERAQSQALSQHLERTEQVVAIAPKDPRVLKDYAKALEGKNKIDEAKQQYKLILKIDPKNVHALHCLGAILLGNEKFEAAEKQFLKCLEIRPRYIKVIKDYGKTLEKMKRPMEASKQYEKALEINPEDVECLKHYGGLLQRLKKPIDAMEQYVKALKIEPKNESIVKKMENTLDELQPE